MFQHICRFSGLSGGGGGFRVILKGQTLLSQLGVSKHRGPFKVSSCIWGIKGGNLFWEMPSSAFPGFKMRALVADGCLGLRRRKRAKP